MLQVEANGEDRTRACAWIPIAAFVLLQVMTASATVQPDGGPAPTFLRNVDGTLFFATYQQDAGGWRLWKSDGTPHGTVALRDGLGLDVELVAVDDRLVFSTRGGLWTSDGTPAGTVLVKALPFYPNDLKNVRGSVYFSDGQGGLWKSDLTSAGTTLVRRIPPGFLFHDLTPAAIASVNGMVLFRAVDNGIGTELWRSDGTAAGTLSVANLNPSAGAAPQELLSTGSTLFFSATDGQSGHELWRSDGTESGTVMVKDINPGGDSWPMHLHPVGDTIYFSADDGTGPELWKTDGTEAGTVKVVDLNPAGGSYPNGFAHIDGTLYFRADDGRSGVELWKTDGTPDGTVQVVDLNPTGSSAPASLRNVNGRLLFAADDGVHGEELWTSDGTAGGTFLVANLNPAGGSFPRYAVNVEGRLFFAADDGTHGTQLWTVRVAGAHDPYHVEMIPLPGAATSRLGVPYLVKDVNPGAGDGEPYGLTAVGQQLFFSAFRPDSGVEPWVSDGTDAGTRLVRDINPGADGSEPYLFTDLGGTAFFVAYDPASGAELWRSDGTEAGTGLVRDIAPGWASSNPSDLIVAGGTVWFLATPPGLGREVWHSDGTEGGTAPMPNPFDDHAYTATEIAVGDTVFIALSDPTVQRPALWSTDGSPEGTRRLGAFRNRDRVRQLTPVGGQLFFRVNGDELWRSDGTAAGTVMLKAGLNPEEMTAVGKRLYFSGRTPVEGAGRELWKSNGTPGGTLLVKDINPGAGDSLPAALTDVNGTLFFRATDGASGFELWKSDGTWDGTVLVRDIDPTDVTLPSYFKAVGDLLYFTARTPSFGYELWRSDGTAAGTFIVRDINRTRSSYPESPAVIGNTLFFNADDGRFGEELWAVVETTVTSTTTSTVVSSTTEPVTSSTTTTSSSSSTTTTSPPELCGNCVDDDGDGLADLDDPDCCAGTVTMQVARLRLGSERGRGGFRLRAVLRDMSLVAVRGGMRDVVLQLRGAPGAPPFCASIPSTRLVTRKRGVRFKDPGRAIPSAGGVTGLRLDRARHGAIDLTARGPATLPPPADGRVELRVGFVTPGAADGRSECASRAVATPRGGKDARRNR